MILLCLFCIWTVSWLLNIIATRNLVFFVTLFCNLKSWIKTVTLASLQVWVRYNQFLCWHTFAFYHCRQLQKKTSSHSRSDGFWRLAGCEPRPPLLGYCLHWLRLLDVIDVMSPCDAPAASTDAAFSLTVACSDFDHTFQWHRSMLS